MRPAHILAEIVPLARVARILKYDPDAGWVGRALGKENLHGRGVLSLSPRAEASFSPIPADPITYGSILVNKF